MGWVDKMKHKIRSWLNVRAADPAYFDITETLDYEGNAVIAMRYSSFTSSLMPG